MFVYYEVVIRNSIKLVLKINKRLSYRRQIARKLCTQYVESRPTVTL